MVSHDLKSPVRNVHSLVSWVFEDGSNAFQDRTRENVDLVFQNLAKMDSLIDGILKHATIDSLEEKLTIVDLNQLVKEIENTLYVPPNTKIRLRNELTQIVYKQVSHGTVVQKFDHQCLDGHGKLQGELYPNRRYRPGNQMAL